MTAPNPPTHERVFRQLRDMVLFGELAPGQPVTLHGLVGTLGVSTTPVREAVRRLTAAGALEFRDNRRIVVPVLDAAALDELRTARRALEPELARRASLRAAPLLVAELSRIDAALDELRTARRALEPELARRASLRAAPLLVAELSRIDAALDAAIATGDVTGYIRCNHAFHFTLYRQAGSRVLLPLAETLWLRFGPLGRAICDRFGTARMPDRHGEAIRALGAGAAGEVARAIEADIVQGFELMRAGVAG